MKKLLAIILLSIIAFSAVGCSLGSTITEKANGDLTYNGAVYHLVSNDDDFYKYYIIDVAQLDHYRTYETNVGNTAAGEPVNLAFEKAHGDNVLRIYREDGSIDHYFKDGFSFPKYYEIELNGFVGESFTHTSHTISGSIVQNLDLYFDFEQEIVLPSNTAVDRVVECVGTLSAEKYPYLTVGPIYFVYIGNVYHVRVGNDSEVYYKYDPAIVLQPIPKP